MRHCSPQVAIFAGVLFLCVITHCVAGDAVFSRDGERIYAIARTDPGRAASYLHGPGTGITSLPSFSATKLSLLLLEEPSALLVSMLMTSFLIGFNGRQTFPPVGAS